MPERTALRGRRSTLSQRAGGAGSSAHASPALTSINLRDLVSVLERDPVYCKSGLLYKLHGVLMSREGGMS
jgi:hypothetical protein